MERIGIYGGKFNPPHLGHFRGAGYALKALELDRLWMVSWGASPKEETPAPEMCLEMVRLGIEAEKLCPCDCSIMYQGTDDACDMITSFWEQYPHARLVLIVDSETLATLPQGKPAEELIKKVTLTVLTCGGKKEQEMLAPAVRRLEAAGGEVILLPNPATEISSADLQRLLVFEAASPFLPKKVMEFIRENGLYGVGKSYRNLSLDELEQVVVSLLKPNRVAHVRGCRKAAVELARRYGADETDAARAALLHDVTKALDGPLQLTLCREYGIILDNFSTQNPKTLHALTGSLVAERIFGERSAVVQAIRSHTTGKANMNVLEKIIYVADYIEPNRDFPGVEPLRRLAYTDLDSALKRGLQMTLEMLTQQGREISPESHQALEWLEHNVPNSLV